VVAVEVVVVRDGSADDVVVSVGFLVVDVVPIRP